jgi:hypothetical protein
MAKQCTSFKSAVLVGGVLQPHPITVSLALPGTAALESCSWLGTAIHTTVWSVLHGDLSAVDSMASL